MVRAGAVTLALGVMITSLSLITVGMAWLYVGAPFPGFLPAANGIVSQLELPDWPGALAGLRFNDWVAEIDGVPISGGGAVWAHARAVPVGTLVTYTVNHPGLLGAVTPLTVTIPTRTFGLADFFTIFVPLWGTGVFVAVSGFLLYLVRPDQGASRVFLGTSAALSVLLLTGFDYYSSHLFHRLTPLASTVFLGTLLHLAIFFPQARTPLVRRKQDTAAMYAPSLIVGLGLQATMFAHMSAFVVFTNVAFLVSTLSIGAFTVSAFLVSRTSRSSSIRRQARTQAVGIGVLSLIPLLIATLTAIGGASFPIGVIVPLGAGLALVAPYSLASLLEEDRVIRFFFRERYHRVQSLRLLSQDLVGASSLLQVGAAVTAHLQASIGRGSQMILVSERLGLSERERLGSEGAASENSVREAVAGGAPVGSLPAARYFAIQSEDLLVGTLALELDSGDDLSDEEIGLLEGFCSQAAVAIERTLAFSALADLNKNLERIVRVRTATLESQNRVLEELNREIELYARALSHDLRSPIVSLGSVFLLMERATPPDAPDLHKYLGMGRLAVDRALKMLDGLLEMTHTVRQAEPIEEVSLDAVARELGQEFQPDIRSKGIQFDIEPLPTVFGRREKLRHLFRNLVGNAVKYVARSPDKQIHVGCFRSEVADEWIVYVQDNGIGMPEHYQPHIFDLFHRVPSEETIPSVGVGMGLAIAKQVMELHGGRIWVESREGAGSTFFVSFPDGSDCAQASSVHGRTILLVEDDETIVQAVEALLTADGANVIVARTGEKGLEELRSRMGSDRPDAILLDIGLPGMSGPDVLAQLRKPGSPWMSMPVVVCSDPRNAAEGERCLMLGAHEFVPKDSRFNDALSASLRTIKWIA